MDLYLISPICLHGVDRENFTFIETIKSKVLSCNLALIVVIVLTLLTHNNYMFFCWDNCYWAYHHVSRVLWKANSRDAAIGFQSGPNQFSPYLPTVFVEDPFCHYYASYHCIIFWVGFTDKSLYVVFFYSVRAACQAHLIHLHLIALIMFIEEHTLWNPFCNFISHSDWVKELTKWNSCNKGTSYSFAFLNFVNRNR